MKGKSVIWDYFEIDEKNKAELKCKIANCGHRISRGSTNPKEFNTSNPWAHLRILHPDEAKKAKESKEAKGKKETDNPDNKNKTMNDYF